MNHNNLKNPKMSSLRLLFHIMNKRVNKFKVRIRDYHMKYILSLIPWDIIISVADIKIMHLPQSTNIYLRIPFK